VQAFSIRSSLQHGVCQLELGAVQESLLPISWGPMGSLVASPGTLWVSCRDRVHPPSLPGLSILSLRGAEDRVTGRKAQRGWMEVTQRPRSAGAGGNSLYSRIFSLLPALSSPSQPLCNAERSKARGWQPPAGFTTELSRAAAEHASFPSCQLLPSATSLPSSSPGVLTRVRRYHGG